MASVGTENVFSLELSLFHCYSYQNAESQISCVADG